ncbi:MAG: glutamate-1-semialdehyde 2,1-aminomutase [Bacteroidetes bacterium]|nr:glutamate-1-semialdehyde 2,1-aminomutase [Bacteroidota bacterium]
MYEYISSKALFERAQKSIPGGVNSPVRAFKGVGGTPLFITKAQGAYLYDADHNRYIDFIASWGPMILGHANKKVVKAIQEQALKSSSYGAPTLLEIEMAELMKSMVPHLDMVRMVNSGTEACMSALRLARGITGKNKFIKFDGCYHGHADPFLVKAGSGIATMNIQDVPGIPSQASNDTLTCSYNDLNELQNLIDQYPHEIAAIIVEPVAGNMGCVLPRENFLQELRAICHKEDILLIFDEVMTGFRLAPGGAQEKFKVQADIITYGKVIGGGLPVGAFAGRKEIMEHIAPLGNVYQAGTLSGNPLAMSAGMALLSQLKNDPSIYKSLEEKTTYLVSGLKDAFQHSAIPFTINQCGSMLSIFFTGSPVHNFKDASASETHRFSNFFHAMLKRGCYLPPSAFESWFLNDGITFEDIDYTVHAVRESLDEIGL